MLENVLTPPTLLEMGIFRQPILPLYENAGLDDLPDMHDGFFDGLWTSYLFLRTYTGERSMLVLKDVERIDVSNFKAGNIILDVVFVDSSELTVEHI